MFRKKCCEYFGPDFVHFFRRLLLHKNFASSRDYWFFLIRVEKTMDKKREREPEIDKLGIYRQLLREKRTRMAKFVGGKGETRLWNAKRLLCVCVLFILFIFTFNPTVPNQYFVVLVRLDFFHVLVPFQYQPRFVTTRQWLPMHH